MVEADGEKKDKKKKKSPKKISSDGIVAYVRGGGTGSQKSKQYSSIVELFDTKTN